MSELSKPEVLPTLRFYKEMISHYKYAKVDGFRKIWLMSFICGIVGDVGFFLCTSYLLYLLIGGGG